VLRIKHLLLVDGLTLAGVRRKLDEEMAPVAADAPLDELMGRHARERITAVKHGLRSLLDLLAGQRGAGEDFRLSAPPLPARSATAAPRTKSSSTPKSSSASRTPPRRRH